MIKQSFYLFRRKLADKSFTADTILFKLSEFFIYALTITAFAGAGFMFAEYTEKRNVYLDLSLPLIIIFPILSDLLIKLIFYNNNKSRISLLEILPIKKKAVIRHYFFSGLLRLDNLCIPAFALPFSITNRYTDAAFPYILFLFLSLTSLTNAAFANILKLSIEKKEGSKSLILLLIILAFTGLYYVCSRQINPLSQNVSLFANLLTAIMLVLALAELYTAYRFYLKLNYYGFSKQNSSEINSHNVAHSWEYWMVILQGSRTTLKTIYITFIVLSILVPFYVYFWDVFNLGKILLISIFMMPGLLGELSFSSESAYMDRLWTLRPNMLYKLLLAKYRIGLVWDGIILLTTLAIAPKEHLFPIVALALYASGSLMFVYFLTPVFVAKRFNIMQSDNTSSFGKFSIVTSIFIIISMTAAAVLNKLTSLNITCSVFSAIGLCFILTHTLWVKSIYKLYLTRRHNNFTKYRTLVS